MSKDFIPFIVRVSGLPSCEPVEGYVEDDFNTMEKQGLRAALRVDLGDSWTATASATYQETETEGIWDHDPDELDDFEVSRFFDDRGNDEWTQFSLVLEGDLGFADDTLIITSQTDLARSIDKTPLCQLLVF